MMMLNNDDDDDDDDDDEKLVFQSKPRQNLYSICRKTPAQFEFQKMILEVILISWIMLSALRLLMSWIKTWQNCVKMLARCCSKEQIPSYCYQVCSTQPHGRVVRVPTTFYRMWGLLYLKAYTGTNSPNWSPYISLKNVLREFDKRSRHFLLGDHFINSHYLISCQCMDIVRRKLMLVTIGNWRVKVKLGEIRDWEYALDAGCR